MSQQPRTRAYRRPLPPAVTAARILAAIRQREAQGQHWTLSEFTAKPDTIRLIEQTLTHERTRDAL